MFTQEEIIEMAGKVYGTTDFHKSALFHLEAFAKLVMDKAAEREREACAERAWKALINKGADWSVRQLVSDAITQKGET